MGNFRIEIQCVGGHGCQREKRNGATLEASCGSPGCPDCLAREFVGRLKAIGCSFASYGSEPGGIGFAKLTHWPYSNGTVHDDLLTGVRSGSF